MHEPQGFCMYHEANLLDDLEAHQAGLRPLWRYYSVMS